MTLRNLRAGLIGTGFIGPVHAEALARLGIRLTAICGSVRGSAALAKRYGVEEVFDDYDAASLVRSPKVDVVHVTSPNRFHHAQALSALRAGKHCVCEKPLALTTRETAELVAAARKSRRVLAVSYNVRFYPAVLKMRRMVARGDLGRIVHVHGSYFQDWLLKDTDYNWRLLPAEGGKLRAVADIGTHWIDTVSFILDSRVRELLADLGLLHKTRQRPLGEIQTFAKSGPRARTASFRVATEDFASILLGFAGGVRGTLGVSQVAAGRKNSIRIEIYGSERSAGWSSEEQETLVVGSRDGANEVIVRASEAFGVDAAPFVDYPAGHVEGFPDTFKMLFRNVYSHIAGEKAERLYATAEDGHEEVKVCEAVLRSHASRAWVKV